MNANFHFGREERYDFRKRMAAPRVFRTAPFSGEKTRADEIPLEGEWAFIAASDDPTLLHGAADLRDYLEKRCRVSFSETAAKRIIVKVAEEKNRLTSRITVTDGEVVVSGATAREALQGCYRLEDELEARDFPVVRRGTRTYTRMYSPRMTHSGYEIEKFPDWHMDQIAHAGMDAILVYITDAPDITRNGRVDMNDLVRRAAVHGLDVYAYFDWWGRPLEKHPLDPGAREYYDSVFGAIVKNAPGLKGMICVGESCPFPSRDANMGGYAWESVPGKQHNGFWPCSDWKEWLELVRDVTRPYNPDFDIVFWTYNWFCAPVADRVALLEKIPTDITLHVTYEMGDVAVVRNGVETGIDDYSITRPGPGTTFVSEAAVAGRRGIRLTSMTNTGGRTWDFGPIPFVPAPYRWIDRFTALRNSREKYGLSGLMDSHHYGFAPSFISDIAKTAFTEETTLEDMHRRLAEIAAHDFGPANTEAVLAAWRDWSDAMVIHSARSFDQYGPLRVGCTFPFTFYGENLPDPPMCLGVDTFQKGGQWKYLWTTAGTWRWGRLPKEHIVPYIEMAEEELRLWQSGNARLAAALPSVPEDRRKAAARMLGIGEFCAHTVRTSRNVKKYWLAGFVYTDETASPEEKTKAREELLAILDDEERNVRELLPFVEADSQLGWEPSMRYVADGKCLEWKLAQLREARSLR